MALLKQMRIVQLGGMLGTPPNQESLVKSATPAAAT